MVFIFRNHLKNILATIADFFRRLLSCIKAFFCGLWHTVRHKVFPCLRKFLRTSGHAVALFFRNLPQKLWGSRDRRHLFFASLLLLLALLFLCFSLWRAFVLPLRSAKEASASGDAMEASLTVLEESETAEADDVSPENGSEGLEAVNTGLPSYTDAEYIASCIEYVSRISAEEYTVFLQKLYGDSMVTTVLCQTTDGYLKKVSLGEEFVLSGYNRTEDRSFFSDSADPETGLWTEGEVFEEEILSLPQGLLTETNYRVAGNGEEDEEAEDPTDSVIADCTLLYINASTGEETKTVYHFYLNPLNNTVDWFTIDDASDETYIIEAESLYDMSTSGYAKTDAADFAELKNLATVSFFSQFVSTSIEADGDIIIEDSSGEKAVVPAGE